MFHSSILEGIRHGRRLHFTYTSQDGKTSERVVSPFVYGIQPDRDGAERLLLQGFQHSGGSGEHFAEYYTDQITGDIFVLDEASEPSPLTEAHDSQWIKIFE